ncbi:hypothetical protein E0L36_19010 [Streptomyces sp. AJS327]|uniref:hypothetical protein n=1 Tax=Streptomyces sp. AJS327 TaxID=2545265 RepID=UPI0015DF0E37|nr:hypothetical protein [Streptomyces sp. AJS327]MBA0052886.1 hypothetical protein [Streptomyces sp. AJS327]
MHMNSAPHLLPEDRPEFERAVDAALRAEPRPPGNASAQDRPGTEELRAMALGATVAIAACAAVEYQRFVRLRAEWRETAGHGGDATNEALTAAGSGTRAGTGGPDGAVATPDRSPDSSPGGFPGTDGTGVGDGAETGGRSGSGGGTRSGDSGDGTAAGRQLAGTAATESPRRDQDATPEHGLGGEPGAYGQPGVRSGTLGDGLAESAGAGVTAVVSVLAPVLAGTAALIFLLIGYALLLVSPEPAMAAPIRTAGWAFAAMAAAAALISMAAVWRSALRNGSRSVRAPGRVTGDGARRTPAAQRPVGPRAETRQPLSEQVAEARDAWREALVERGIVPFLREAADARNQGRPPATPPPEQRTPQLGYSHPGFSSRAPAETPIADTEEERRRSG